MKKWLGRLLAGLIFCLALLAGTGWYLLATQSGVLYLLQISKSFIPGDLSVQQVEGHLLGKLLLTDLKYENPDMTVNLGELAISWQPKALWQRLLHINYLNVDRVKFSWRKPPDDVPTEPLVLNDIKLPLEIQLDSLLFKRMEILAAVDAVPVEVDKLSLSADWISTGLNLNSFELTAPQGMLQGKGKLNPVDNYPLQLATNIALTMEGVPNINTNGSISGDLQKLALKHEITGDMTASISANLDSLLEELKWNLQLNLTQLPADFLPTGFPGNLLLALQGSGDLAQGDMELQASLPKANQTSEGTLPKSAATPTMQLTASSRFSDLSFEVLGSWENLQWPPTGPVQYGSRQGKLTLTGSMEEYQFTLHGDVAGADTPGGKLKASGKGDMEHVVLERLQGTLLEGELDLAGKINWKPTLGWEVQVDATGINPGVIAPEWPGKLELSVASSGQLESDKLSLNTEIKQLAGTLRDRDLSGSGRFVMDPNKISLQQVAMKSGQASFLADGDLSETWDLNWQLDVPDLADLLPQASGLIRGAGKLHGDRAQPVVEGQLDLEQVIYQDISLQTGNGNFSLGLNPQYQSKVLLETGYLLFAGQQTKGLSLKLDGTLESHDIKLSILHEMAELQLVSSGGYNAGDTAAWKGQLQNLTIVGEKTGNWQLKTPAQLDLSAVKVVVEAMCLQELQTVELCAQANWLAESQGTASVSLKQVPLEHLSPWLPPQITKLDGKIDADMNVDLEAVNASLNATIEPGILAYLDPQGGEISMQHHGGEIRGVLDKQEMQANWKLELDQHSLSGDVHIPRVEFDKDPNSASVSGKMQIELKDLNLVTGFVPAIHNIDGSADVDLQIQGRVDDPRISGHAKVQASSVSIPLAGLDLRDVNISINGQGGNKLDIQGGVSSGEGRLDLSGDLLLDGSKGWPLQLALKGEQFQAANLPDAQLIISPELQLSTLRDIMKLRGKVLLSKAVMELKELPEGSESTSSDVVIVEEGVVTGGASGYKVDANIALELGDEIHFRGFGAKASLAGRLTINNIPGQQPTAHGELKVLAGSYRAYGQDLTIDRGRISYAGGYLNNPAVILRASRRIDDTQVGIDATGTVNNLNLTGFSSDPDMNSDDAISMLLTGQRSSDPGKARVYAGKELSKDLSVGVNLGAGAEGTEIVVRYRLMDNVNLEGTSSSQKSGGRIMYGFEIE